MTLMRNDTKEGKAIRLSPSSEQSDFKFLRPGDEIDIDPEVGKRCGLTEVDGATAPAAKPEPEEPKTPPDEGWERDEASGRKILPEAVKLEVGGRKAETKKLKPAKTANEAAKEMLMGIRGVDEEIAEMLMLKYKGTDDIVAAGAKKLERLPGIGRKRARAIIKALS